MATKFSDILQPPESFLKESRSNEVLAAGIVLLILPTLAVSLRIWSRWIARAGFWWDDYSIIVAMVLSWGPCIAMLEARGEGLGRHLLAIGYLALDVRHALRPFLKNLYAFQLLYTIAITSARVSIILFLHRIFPIVHFRRFLLGCHAYNIILVIAAILTEVLACMPTHYFWDRLAGRPGGKCINVRGYYTAAGSINSATNFILLALPIPLLSRLRTTNVQKLVITIFFFFGLTVCAVGVTHVIVTSNLRPGDLTWNDVGPAKWTAAEPSIAVVCACIPSFRPLFSRLLWGREYRPKHISHSSQQSLGRTWLGRGTDSATGRFNRLRESGGGSRSGSDFGVGYGSGKGWLHNVAVSGGKSEDAGREEFMMGGGARASQYGMPPDGGIRVKTTITVTERVDWQDDLF